MPCLPSAEVLKSFHDVCPNAAFFTSIPGFQGKETDTDSDNDNELYPQLLTTFFDEENTNLCDDQIRLKCNFIRSNYQCSPDQCSNLELATRNQTVCPLWYNHRKGRITGTKAHDVLVRRQTTPPDNLVKRIVGYRSFDISSKTAVKYGTDHEADARHIYTVQQINHHQNFTCRQSGFLIDSNDTFFGASADGIVDCGCCGKGVLEIKCPFSHKTHTAHEAANMDSNFYFNTDLRLKTGHKYYTQIQLQMHVNKVRYCDFVVFTQPCEPCIQITRIHHDDQFCKHLIKATVSFWTTFVLPELVSGRLEITPAATAATPDIPTATPVWCICAQPEYGKMIKCDNINCKTEWFHYPCVNVKRKPTRKWMCPSCKD